MRPSKLLHGAGSRPLAALLLAATFAAVGLGARSAAAVTTRVASRAYFGGLPTLNLFTQAPCPGGEVAVGGGTDATDPSVLALVRSHPLFPPPGFVNLPDGEGPAPSGWDGLSVLSEVLLDPRVKVAAVCAEDWNVVTSIGSTNTVAGVAVTASASCPGGRRAISAGWSGSDVAPGAVLAFEPTFASESLADLPAGPAPAPVGWTVTVRSDLDLPGGLKLGVVCLAGRSVSTLVGALAAPGGGDGFGGVSCPPGFVATGGGHASPPAAPLPLVGHGPSFGGERLGTRADGSHGAPDGFGVVVRNAGAPATIAVAAVCVPEPPVRLAGVPALVALVTLWRSRSARAAR